MKKRNDRAKERRLEAEERQARYDALTVKEKVAKLDDLFGKGVGAKKERAKLASMGGK